MWQASILETDLNLQYPTLSSTTSSLTFNGYPGNYTVQYWAYGDYITSVMAQQQFTITDSDYSINITFYETFPVTVEAHNIPANFSWGFNLEGNPTNQYLFGQPGTFVNGSKQVQDVVNGTYSLYAGEQVYYDLSIYSLVGNMTVNGAPLSLNLSFNTLNLTAVGLPENTSWGFYGSNSFMLSNGSMHLSHALYPGKAVNVTFHLPNGKLNLQPVAKGYYSNGVDLKILSPYTNATLVFRKEYPVTFNANGVSPFMQEWQVSGIPYTFEGSPPVIGPSFSLTYMIPNGTYNASISFPYGSTYWVKVNGTNYLAKMTPDPANMTITVAGKSQSVNLTFHIAYMEYAAPMQRSIEASLIVGGILGILGSLIGAVALADYLRKRN